MENKEGKKEKEDENKHGRLDLELSLLAWGHTPNDVRSQIPSPLSQSSIQTVPQTRMVWHRMTFQLNGGEEVFPSNHSGVSFPNDMRQSTLYYKIGFVSNY